MAFFPRYQTEASFTPLFRLLDDFDSYARQGQNGRTSRPAIAFQPKFDVRELENHFELHGELAGLNKDNVQIEFTDPHTLRIHGRIERNYSSAPAPATLAEDAHTNDANADVDDNKSTTSAKSHQATVEDEDAEWTDGAEAARTKVQKQPPRQQPEPEKKQTPPRAKFWCTERSIGEFSRTFNFPGQIQQDAVTASLNEGILTIKVPKAPKHEARRIAIN